MTQIGQELELTVSDINVDGGAVARHEGRVVFLDRGLPGERLRARVSGEKKRVLLAEALETLAPSPDAVEPFCRYFGQCGGCPLQNYAYPAQLELKRKQAAQVFSRIGGLDLQSLPGLCEDDGLPRVIASPKLSGYRNKMEYAFGEAVGRVTLGLRRRASHEVLDIERCPLQGEAAGLALGAVRGWANLHALSVWREEPSRSGDERGAPGRDKNLAAERASSSAGFEESGAAREGCLRYLVVREPEYAAEGKPQLLVELICGAHLPPKPAVEELWELLQPCGVTSLVLSQRRSRLGLARGERIFRVFGSRTLWEDFGGLLLEFPVSGFSQTNTDAASLLYKEAASFAGGCGDAPAFSELWDLYSGVGALALALSGHAQRTLGVELDEQSARLAHANAARLGKTGCAFAAADAASLMESLFWPKNRPRLLPGGFSGPDMLVTDPPRSGMSEKVLRSILRARPRVIVYVSCDPATQARDAAFLRESYRIDRLTLVDMFPHTPHVESICRLVLRD